MLNYCAEEENIYHCNEAGDSQERGNSGGNPGLRWTLTQNRDPVLRTVLQEGENSRGTPRLRHRHRGRTGILL